MYTAAGGLHQDKIRKRWFATALAAEIGSRLAAQLRTCWSTSTLAAPGLAQLLRFLKSSNCACVKISPNVWGILGDARHWGQSHSHSWPSQLLRRRQTIRRGVRLLAHTRSWSMIDGGLPPFLHLPFFQRTTDNTCSASMNTQTRHWEQTRPTSAANSAAAPSPTPSQNRKKSLAHRASEIWKEPPAHSEQLTDSSLGPMFHYQAGVLLARNPSTRMTEASSPTRFLSWQSVKSAKKKC